MVPHLTKGYAWGIIFLIQIHKAYRVELNPNNKQTTCLKQHVGAARWVYNWGLQRKIESYAVGGKSYSEYELSNQLTQLKKSHKWLRDVSDWATRNALVSLEMAFKAFFRRCRRGESKKGFPRFKTRKKSRASFRLGRGSRPSLDGRYAILPKLGMIRMKQVGYVPQGKKILSATISEEADRWFCSFLVVEDIPDPPQPQGEVLGVDLGVRVLATLSDGTTFDNPKALAKYERKLKHLQRCLARKQKGSKNREKARKKLGRQHYRIKCVRRDAQHKMTTAIIKRASVLVLENLNVAGMVKNHKLAKAVSDASFVEIRRQLEYKAKWRGIPVILADRWFPSTKTCSRCGTVKDTLTLAERTFHCAGCGLILDRDHNAAINLKNLAVGSTVTACGGDVSPGSHVQATPLKQEARSSRSVSRADLPRS